MKRWWLAELCPATISRGGTCECARQTGSSSYSAGSVGFEYGVSMNLIAQGLHQDFCGVDMLLSGGSRVFHWTAGA